MIRDSALATEAQASAHALRLDTEARVHKASAEYHRREAARKRAEFAKFIEECGELGITVIIEPPAHVRAPMPEGGTSGDNAAQEVRTS